MLELGNQFSVATLGEEFHRAFETALVHARKRLGQTHSLWINGRSLKSSAGTFQTILPADTRVPCGRFQKATREQVRRAVNTAQEAGQFWREFGWQQRVSYLRKAAEVLADHQHELAALISLEVGKCRSDAFAEVNEAIQAILYYCQQTERHQGFAYRLNGPSDELNQCTLRPHGVWALVTAFNTPCAIPVGAAVAAMAGGNTVVFKPASRASLIGVRLTALLHDAGLPVGVFNLVTGPGPEMVKELAANPAVNGFVFSGTTSAGLDLLRQVVLANPRPCLAVMGGCNPVIVMPSANLEHAAEGIVRSAFAANGQHCAACRRVYVHRKVSKRLVDLIVERTAALPVGDPLARETVIGPLINEQAVAQYKQVTGQGRRQGRLRIGGSVRAAGDLQFGFYVEPVVIDQLPVNARLFDAEQLVPVLGVAEVATLEEAITCANQTAYGLAAGIFTTLEQEQVAFFNQIEASATYCNRRAGATTGGWPGQQTVGGWKASGSACRNALGPFYVPLFLREQSQTIIR